MYDSQMILRPIDFSILHELTKGRNVAGNIHLEIDSARAYVNERIGVLADYGLVRKVGPNENVGLYEITEKGELALEYRDLYKEDQDQFESILAGDIEVDDLECDSNHDHDEARS